MKPDYHRSKLPPYLLLDESVLVFESDDSATDVNPLRGLHKYGAYSEGAFRRYTPELRIATMAPASGWPRLRQMVNDLRSAHAPSDRKDYVPHFPGFEQVFRVPLVASDTPAAHIKWPDNLSLISRSQSPQDALVQALESGVNRLALVRDQFDVALVHLPDAWEAAFRGPGFDAHDALKALGAAHGIPTQVINDRSFSFSYKASLAWRLSIALYVKAGGIPWKLGRIGAAPDDSAFIGLAYALRSDSEKAQFVTCCSQVFDADGGGMQFVAFEARDPVEDLAHARRNPFLSRSDMRSVLARSLELYQRRNGGAIPRRLVVHKTTAFKESELEGVQDALAAVREVECLSISGSPSWRGVWLKEGRGRDRRSEPDRFPVPRGTVLQQTGSSALVWVGGNAPGASTKGDYYQGGKSIPRPIRITRSAGSGPLELAALEALALTKMDWNNDALYDPVPVTIRYSQRLARTIANVPSLPGKSYPYRLFM